MRGLGDYSQWISNITFLDTNGNSLGSFGSLSSIEQGQALNALASAAYFGQPAGSTITITVNPNGAASDCAAFSLIPGPGSNAYGETSNSPYLKNCTPISQEYSRASDIMSCGAFPCSQAGSNQGAISSAEVANLQMTPAQVAALGTQYAAQAAANTAAMAAAGTTPTVISSAAPPAGPGVPAAAASPVVATASTSTGIPWWVWLIGGGVVIYFIYEGTKQ